MNVRYLNIIKSIKMAEVRKKSKIKANKYVGCILFGVIGFVALSIFIFSYVGFLLIPIYQVYSYRLKIKKSLTLPFNYLININVKSDFISDGKKPQNLMSLDKQRHMIRQGITQYHSHNIRCQQTLVITQYSDSIH